MLTIVSELTEVSMVCVHTSFVEGEKNYAVDNFFCQFHY